MDRISLQLLLEEGHDLSQHDWSRKTKTVTTLKESLKKAVQFRKQRQGQQQTREKGPSMPGLATLEGQDEWTSSIGQQLQKMAISDNMSNRQAVHCAKIARTLADLDLSNTVDSAHLDEARQMQRGHDNH